MCRALISASTSNYLNCAYRSYCTVHFPLESYTLSSCLPAALAVEISTLGNFVLHNNYCTWGMFLSKNVWTERKNSFLAQPHSVLLFPSLFVPLSSPPLLFLIARTRKIWVSAEKPFFLVLTTPHRWLLCDFTISMLGIWPLQENVALWFFCQSIGQISLCHLKQQHFKEYYAILWVCLYFTLTTHAVLKT